MILSFLRLAVFGFLALSVIFVIAGLYARWAQAQRLKKEWQETGGVGAREDYVKAGLADWEQSARAKALWLIYIVPVLIVLVILILTNFT